MRELLARADPDVEAGKAAVRAQDWQAAIGAFSKVAATDYEYIGEAYLMKGDVAKAKEHLATLDRLCLFGCGEYSAVKKSIAGFEQKTR
jgi:hypothetical protein